MENGPAGATIEKNNTFPSTGLTRSNSSLSTSSQPGTVVSTVSLRLNWQKGMPCARAIFECTCTMYM